jgi:tRNA nucleotidyltransferase/poly(A) polymerase
MRHIFVTTESHLLKPQNKEPQNIEVKNIPYCSKKLLLFDIRYLKYKIMIRSQIPKFVTFILDRLKTAGHQAYIVGGAVRDFCLQRPLTDWDVATSAQSEEIEAIFRDKKFFALKYGTVTLVDSRKRYEVTPFRGRKNCLQEDLARRDFTINAMAYDPEKAEFLDPFGGNVDITRKTIRSVGDPRARFSEDPLRLLRATRFAAELGFRIDPVTLGTLSRMASLLHLVAPERIREELVKLLVSPKPSIGFNLMVRTLLLKYFLPELLEGYRKRQNAHHQYTIFKHIMETVDTVEPVPVLRITALLHDIAKPEEVSASLAEEIMDRLKFSKGVTGRVTKLIRHHMILYDARWSDAAIRRLIRRVGLDQIMDILTFRRADLLAHGLIRQKPALALPSSGKAGDLGLLKELEGRIKDQFGGTVVTQVQDLAIDGYKVMEVLGFSPGPEVGKILKYLMEKITDDPELNEETRLTLLLEQMKRM